MNEELETKIQFLKGVGPKVGERLRKLGIETVRDLVFHWPRAYLDYTNITRIGDIGNPKSEILPAGRHGRNPKQRRKIGESFENSESSDMVSIFDIRYSDSVCIKGRIVGISNKLTSKRFMKVTEAVIEDGTGTIKLIWFNQPFLKDYLKPGSEWIFRGKVSYDWFNQTYVMESPSRVKSPCIVPIYPETRGISSGYISKLVSRITYHVSGIDDFLPDKVISANRLLPLKDAVLAIHAPKNQEQADAARKRLAFDELFLMSLRSRLAKGEAKKPAMPISLSNQEIDSFIKGLPFELTGDQRKAVEEILNDMRGDPHPNPLPCRNMGEGIIKTPSPFQGEGGGEGSVSAMNRLLNGDVGSGKTVVAAVAAYAAVKSGFRVAVMVPTEVLATQHFETFSKLFGEHGISVGLLTSTMKRVSVGKPDSPSTSLKTGKTAPLRQGFEGQASKQDSNSESAYTLTRLPADILPQKADIVIGTHALLQDKVKLENIGLVVVDEQHRFGVRQRAELQKIRNPKSCLPAGMAEILNKSEIQNHKSPNNRVSDLEIRDVDLSGNVPHFLSMTATPIPRTMHLALFGDLEVSVIEEKPKNRKEIKTRFVEPFNRQKAYDFIRLQIKAGRQVFVVCPLIEESETDSNGELRITNYRLFDQDKKSVVKESERLQKEVFPEFKVAVLHGKMKSKEKDEILKDFHDKKSHILVSTSVIEVGIDVPNAAVMMIEDAERFGLAQIHQFRGRVGRGEQQSFCFLFSVSRSEKSLARLKHLEAISDGFKLAEIDLETRGPGDILGTMQSGQTELKLASFSDKILMIQAAESAKDIFEQGLSKYPKLVERLQQFDIAKHFE